MKKKEQERLNQALFDAVKIGDSHWVQSAIEAGAEVNAQGQWQRMPLHLAANNPNPEVTQVLLDNGATVNATDQWQQTPLHIAARHGHTETAQLLLGRGAKVSARDIGDKTPVDHAIAASDNNMFALLENRRKERLRYTDLVAERRDLPDHRER